MSCLLYKHYLDGSVPKIFVQAVNKFVKLGRKTKYEYVIVIKYLHPQIFKLIMNKLYGK